MEKIMAVIMVFLFILGATALSDTDSANSESITETVESTVFDVEASNVDPEMYKYIEKQIESGTDDNLLAVAKCKTATTQQLIRVAEACANFHRYKSYLSNKEAQIDIATALLSNPNSTDAVAVELANSDDIYFLDLLVNSEIAKENSLIIVANKIANYNYTSSWYNNLDRRVKLTNLILANPNTTDSVVLELAKSEYSDIWEILIVSDKTNTKTLKILIGKCAEYKYSSSYTYNSQKRKDMLSNIALNPNTTDDVMLEMVNSDYYEAWRIVSISDKAKETSLKQLAKKVANYDSQDFQKEIADNLAKHPNTTTSVMAEFSNSNFQNVVDIGHHWIENNT